jgi:anti-sigma28 factor (negative regulator of flagellin synthesis)
MRIQGSSTPEVTKRADEAKTPTAVTGEADKASEAGAAPVVVASSAQDIVAGGQRDAAQHASRLSALKDALERGSYKIDYEKLAERIVNDEIERSKRG